MSKQTFDKPNNILIFFDLIFWLFSVLLVSFWRLISEKSVIYEYIIYSLFLFVLWFIFGDIFGKYNHYKGKKKLRTYSALLFTALATILVTVVLIGFNIEKLSLFVVLIQTVFVFFISLIFNILYNAYRYAVNAEKETVEYEEREPHKPVPSYPLDEQFVKNIRQMIVQNADITTLNYFEQFVNFGDSNVKVLNTSQLFNISSLQNYRYSGIINLRILNNIRGINKMLCAINEKLNDGGLLFCICIPQEEYRKQFLAKYPKYLRTFALLYYFIFKRILPKLLITSRLYFDVTNAKNRVLSQTEVFGRLYYCGFEVVDYKEINSFCVICARQKRHPFVQDHRVYGPLIKLNRVGKNGKAFIVYKMRTMHPYSEFLQAYVYEKYGLQEGGKIENDIRVSKWGKFLRKYWLDELPMFLNFLKGNMKLVGVRPLSNHYFSLYSKELQEKRIKHKPGLLPPFYADMPKTLDEIQASEMKYLTECEKNGTFVTDVKYIWLIFVNIVFKKARSH